MAALAVKFTSLLARHATKNKLLHASLVPKVELCLRNLSTTFGLGKKEMLEITYETTDGKTFTVQGKEGDNLLDIVVNNDVDLDGFGACEGTLACSTCHLIFKKEDFDRIEEPSTDEELDMLDLAYGLTDTDICVTLTGSGFLGLYQIGALECLQKYGPHLFEKAKFAGASAGSLLAACLACSVPIDLVRNNFMDTIVKAQKSRLGPLHPKFDIVECLLEGAKILPEDAHLRANGRLTISITRAKDRQNVLISHWNSRDELIECLLCSCFIPGFSGIRYPKFRGEKYMDGGFTNNVPSSCPDCIIISPFEGNVGICPNSRPEVKKRPVITVAHQSVYVTATNISRFVHSLKPPSVEFLESMQKCGYTDAYDFIKQKLNQKGQQASCANA